LNGNPPTTTPSSTVGLNFLRFFDAALRVDGETCAVTFSNGMELSVLCLWIHNYSSYIHTHSHELNAVGYQNEQLVMFKAADVPAAATNFIRAKDYIIFNGVKFSINQARLKSGLWTLSLWIFGVTPRGI
jgi:hypothetical protein